MHRSTGHRMVRGRIALIAVLASLLVPAASPAADAGTTPSFQPDGWIKLCGLSLGCTIDPLPHPWLGKDAYNTTGRKQTVAVDIDEGEGARFWITLENDGTQADTFGVVGCPGTRVFEVNRVLLGKHKRQDPGDEDLTRRYKRGTLTFDLDPGKKVVFTLNIITHFEKNETYRCRTEFTSQSDGTKQDVVVAKMTTY
jgi:hypothetical protein